MFFFVSTSLAYITIPKKQRNIKITWDKKLTTTYILILAIHHAQDQIILALRATDEVVAALY